MDLWIGVLAMCLSKEQKCTSEVTRTLFPSEKLCQDYVAKEFNDRKVTCVRIEENDEAEERVTIVPTIEKTVTAIQAPKLEVETDTVPIIPIE